MNDTATKLPAVAGTAQSSAMSFDAMWRLAEAIAKSRLFGMQTPEQALTLMSIAQAEGRHPALAARDFHIIQGAPAKKAEAMLRDFLSSGGRVEWHELTDAAAEATFSHPAGGTVRLRWDQDRVKQAGLRNPMHAKYPRQMLRSRLISEGVRTVCPMATSGLYVPEEVVEFAPQRQAAPIDLTPRADLDQFAATPATDATAGTELHDVADGHAREGTEQFRAWWKTLTPDERAILKPDLGHYQHIAQDADAGRAAERDGDPFGLPPLADEPASPPAGERPGEDRANTSAIVQQPRQGRTFAPRPRSAIWADPSYRIEPQRLPLSDEMDWPNYGHALEHLIGEASEDELGKLRADNDEHLARMRREAGDSYRRITEAIRERVAALGVA